MDSNHFRNLVDMARLDRNRKIIKYLEDIGQFNNIIDLVHNKCEEAAKEESITTAIDIPTFNWEVYKAWYNSNFKRTVNNRPEALEALKTALQSIGIFHCFKSIGLESIVIGRNNILRIHCEW